jgi:thiosulfate/3-mercaptopyruvate sulfurtransferase
MRIRNFPAFFYLIILSVFINSCKDRIEEELIEPIEQVAKSVSSCEGCHTNYTHLKEVHTPDPPSTGGGGCGGDAPHYEPYDRVYLSGTGYEAFKKNIHGKIPCVACHNGVDNTDDKTKAHSGNFLKKPSLNAAEKCGTCHTDIYLGTKNSLHEQGWGQKSMVVLRSGLPNIPNGFDQLSQAMKDGYKTNCGKCHATCGDCHIVRPKAGEGGLANGHQFVKTPDMRNVCVTCHVSRGGHAYFGQATGTQPDVHLTKKQFTCLSCHTKNELHGDGKIYDQRYKMELLPKCENCHNNLSTSNSYHSVHIKNLSCHTCHSQDYNNCGSCHIHGEGARIPAYLDYKIGLNPIPETKPFKFALLRRSLTAPDSWKEYGVANLPNYNVKPNYKYTTPHNILKWTPRTKVDSGKPCFDACHIIKNNDGSYRNKDLYLFRSDLLDWEVGSTQSITVDNKLPTNWGVK